MMSMYRKVINVEDCGSFSIAMSQDGSMIYIESVDIDNGVYTDDYTKIDDENIINSVNSLFDMKAEILDDNN